MADRFDGLEHPVAQRGLNCPCCGQHVPQDWPGLCAWCPTVATKEGWARSDVGVVRKYACDAHASNFIGTVNWRS